MSQNHLKSMTAYGRGAASSPYGCFTVEIQSVNRRHLEMNISAPRAFTRYEIEMRKKIAAHVGRGAIHLSVHWKSDEAQSISLIPNIALAKALQEAWGKLRIALGSQEETIPSALLARQEQLFLYEEKLQDEPQYLETLLAATDQALGALLAMKYQEGRALAADILERLNLLGHEIQSIETLSFGSTDKYRQKLMARLAEFLASGLETDERILKEVALFAERIDVTEEIVRFKSHLEQFRTGITKPLESAVELRGKNLDFLLQELLREANTIGSKASDAVIAKHVIFIKSELEKIREQVQNIE